MKQRSPLNLALASAAISGIGFLCLELLLRRLQPSPAAMLAWTVIVLTGVVAGVFWLHLFTVRSLGRSLDEGGLELHGERRVDLHAFHPHQLAAIGWLAGNVGQELRNPLSSVMNALFYIKDALKDSDLEKKDPALHEFLALAEKELRGVINIISDLLGFSRGIQVSPELADVNALLEEMKGIVDLPASLRLEKKFDSSIPKLLLDKRKIRQVFANLAENAAHSMPNGGVLRISSHLEPSQCVVEFADTGSGIGPEILRRINKPFLGTKAKGLGLGIEICQRVVAAHGGRIRAESKLGKGSTFYVELPLNRSSIENRS